ncbi:MAG: HIT family protein [Myxococcales bacterium]|nr:HIT family protein [Myxococcales bacterium]
MTHAPRSPFLAIPAGHYVARNALAFAIRDGFPVSPGHSLVIPFREVATWFDATVDEQHAIMELVSVVKRELDGGVAWPDGRVVIPDGYNVGFNAGAAAGQTVMHLHVHVIPRFQGDVVDPRGGVRHVIPGRGNYLAKSAPMSTGGDEDKFVDLVREAFAEAREIACRAGRYRYAAGASTNQCLRCQSSASG